MSSDQMTRACSVAACSLPPFACRHPLKSAYSLGVRVDGPPPAQTNTCVNCTRLQLVPYPIAGVDRGGRVYLEYESEVLNIYRMDVDSGQCVEVAKSGNYMFAPMTFSASEDLGGEALFYSGLYSSPAGSTPGPPVLAKLSSSGAWTNIAPEMAFAALTGSADGRLFAAYNDGFTEPWGAMEIDPGSGIVLRQWPAAGSLVPVLMGRGFAAMARWKGSLFLLASDGHPPTAVVKFSLEDETWAYVGDIDIVPWGGLGVSICAPTR